MASLNQLRQNFLNLKGKEMFIAGQAIGEKSEEAANFNALQLAQGLKNDGTKAVFSYAPFTIAAKRGKSGLSGVTSHLTNFDTGESYRQLFEKVEGNKVIFGTTSGLQDEIDKRMDGKAFGLDADNKAEFLKLNVSPLFVQKIKSLLKL